MLSRCFHFGVFEIFVSSLFLLVLFAFWECWYSALYNSEADSQEVDYDDCRRLHLPRGRSTGSASLLRCVSGGEYRWRNLSVLSNVQGVAETPRTDGTSGPLHLLGSRSRRMCDCRVHRHVYHPRFCGRTCNARSSCCCRSSSDNAETAERAALQEEWKGSVRLLPFQKSISQSLTNHYPS